MIYKQIIVDGVDVSGCEFYNKDDKTCREVNGKYDTDICDFDECENSNCYYKQLKAKEQECEELKELVKKQKDVLIHKTILADEYESAYSFENLKVAKLKGCLTEIKEIVFPKNQLIITDSPIILKIQEKISEVEDD